MTAARDLALRGYPVTLFEAHEKLGGTMLLGVPAYRLPELEFGGGVTRYFDPLVRRFMDALRKALPDCDESELFWCHHFLSGALTLTFAETGRIDNLSKGAVKSSDMAAIAERMPKFLAAGFERLCK